MALWWFTTLLILLNGMHESGIVFFVIVLGFALAHFIIISTTVVGSMLVFAALNEYQNSVRFIKESYHARGAGECRFIQ